MFRPTPPATICATSTAPCPATGSLAARLDAGAVIDLAAFERMPGQVGVLIGVGGQPYVGEVFDSAVTLRRQYDAILAAAALDALLAPAVATPGRRARRFVSAVEQVWLAAAGEAGIGERVAGRSEAVDAAGLRWQGRDVHLRMSHVRHPLLVGA